MLTAPAETIKTTTKRLLRIRLGRCKRGFSSRCEFSLIQRNRDGRTRGRKLTQTKCIQQFLGHPVMDKSLQLPQLTGENMRAVAQDRKTLALAPEIPNSYRGDG